MKIKVDLQDAAPHDGGVNAVSSINDMQFITGGDDKMLVHWRLSEGNGAEVRVSFCCFMVKSAQTNLLLLFPSVVFLILFRHPCLLGSIRQPFNLFRFLRGPTHFSLGAQTRSSFGGQSQRESQFPKKSSIPRSRGSEKTPWTQTCSLFGRLSFVFSFLFHFFFSFFLFFLFPGD